MVNNVKYGNLYSTRNGTKRSYTYNFKCSS